ncbi:MAG: hypothetical protein WC242_03890 [Candidatus Paceibacterota bacterium]
MTKLQLITTIFLSGLFSYLTLIIFKKFKRNIKESIIFICPIMFFGLGFLLRFSGKEDLVDLGFLLTELSVLFLSVLFAVFLFLGQLRYWKK